MRINLLLFYFLFPAFCHLSLAAGALKKIEQDVSSRLVPQVLNGKVDNSVLFLQPAAGDEHTIFLVSSEKPFSIYAGPHLIAARVRSFQWNADSLNKTTKGSNRITFFRRHLEPIRLIQISFLPADPLDPIFRKRSGRMNFIIISGALLLMLFSVALSGFSAPVGALAGILNIFTLTIREDRTDEARINSPSSFFGFVVITLFASVMLTILRETDDESTVHYFVIWGSNLVILILFFLLKVLLTILWAWIFNLKGSANHQVTGFFKAVLLLCAGAGALMLLNFFAGNFREPDYFILKFFMPLIFIGFGVTLFFRLMKISAASPLHLFSYLCISEFIPLVLLVFTI
ncbi:MAG: DUF4271 domain-containing protein [Cyclobacteriaceae bacterium]